MAQTTNSPFFNNPTAPVSRNAGALRNGLPEISMGLDSVRTYQFEIHFELPSSEIDPQGKLTLAAKQVSQVGFASEEIEVMRVNDKVFYPGRASPDEMTVTFDNFYQPKVANSLWAWFSTIYDPTNGKFLANTPNGSPEKPPTGGWKAQRATIVQLDAQGQPLMETRLYGVWPKSWKTAEFNYSTNDFHTIEVVFRYDFMEQVTYGADPGSALRAQ
tara:strand:- start:61 stop:708 length:648 start_codon:yes stop_codon:yes gene_type:complete